MRRRVQPILRRTFTTPRWPLWWAAIATSASFLAAHALAGTLTVSGNLTASTNLSAQSITLGGVTQTNWNFLPLQGNKYVIVPEGTNDGHRGNNLRAAYSTATTLGPAATNRVAVIVPPGAYNLGTRIRVRSNHCNNWVDGDLGARVRLGGGAPITNRGGGRVVSRNRPRQ